MAIIEIMQPMPGLVYDYKDVQYFYREKRWYKIGVNGQLFKVDPPDRALIAWGFKREVK